MFLLRRLFASPLSLDSREKTNFKGEHYGSERSY